MKKLIGKQSLGVLALLCSSGAFAATVQVVASNANPNVGDAFYLDVFGQGFPTGTTTTGVGGVSLTITYNPVVSGAGGGTTIVAGPQFTGGAVYADPLLSGDSFTVLGPLSGTLPGGNFGGTQAFRINMIAGPCATVCAANIVLVDDGLDNSWTDGATAQAIPVTYTQAVVTVHGVVPVPAAAWLFGSALGLLGISRRRAA